MYFVFGQVILIHLSLPLFILQSCVFNLENIVSQHSLWIFSKLSFPLVLHYVLNLLIQEIKFFLLALLKLCLEFLVLVFLKKFCIVVSRFVGAEVLIKGSNGFIGFEFIVNSTAHLINCGFQSWDLVSCQCQVHPNVTGHSGQGVAGSSQRKHVFFAEIEGNLSWAIKHAK